jgi:hypothetical protein
MRRQTTWLLAPVLILSAFPVTAAKPPSPDVQIAGAIAAAPPGTGDTATVLGWADDGELVTLREGEGGLVCLADDPDDDRFHVACYHKGLEPFMARGRELEAQGLGATDRARIRHEEIDAGKLSMPKDPSSLSTLSGESFDPATGKVKGARRTYVIYTPYATVESTGLPSKPVPGQPSAPWIMRMGTPSSHVMITPGPDAEEPDERAGG